MSENQAMQNNTLALAIILINYNGFDDTISCINSIKRNAGVPVYIIVVDNASADGSGDELTRYYSTDENINVVINTENGGFSEGNNIGIKIAKSRLADAVLLINNDTEMAPGFIPKLIKDWDKKEVRTCRINYFDDKQSIWYAAGKFNKNKCISQNQKTGKNQYVNFASGCCMLVPVWVFDEVGYLSEEYFMYYEDVDFCLRLERAGIKIKYMDDAIIYHKVGRSSGGNKSKLSVYYLNRNRFFLMKKYQLGSLCRVYTYTTRLIRFVYGYIRHDANREIYNAWKDYKIGITGRSERY